MRKLGRARSGRGNKKRQDGGASLVEFAFVMPLLLILLLGIIEFGYLFGEFNDVRHGAREGARLAAVNAGSTSFLETETCASMDLTTDVSVQFTDSGSGAMGTTGTVRVVASPQPLTGLNFFSVFFPSTLETEIEFRLEQPSEDWASGSLEPCT